MRSSSVQTLEFAMKRLGKYLYGNNSMEEMKVKQMAFYRVGGHVMVVHCMEENPTQIILQMNGLGVLRNASYKNKDIKIAMKKVNSIQAGHVAVRAIELY